MKKTITYIVALRRPGLFIGVKGTTMEAVVKDMKEIGLSKNKEQKEIKIDLVETSSRWSAVKRMEELVDFYCIF